MIKNLLVILAILVMGCVGCKKNQIIIPAPSPGTSYFPETKGSTWNYRDSIYGEKGDTINIYGVKLGGIVYTMTGDITSFNGSIYYNSAIASTISGARTAYFYGLYHRFYLREPINPYGSLDLQVLIDTASVGYSWTSSPTDNTLLNGNAIRTINTIREKNVVKVVGGKTFTNVIHTSVNLQIYVNGEGFQNTIYFDFFLAEGTGLIEKDIYFYNNYNETQTLESYSIK